jgi:adenylate kinase
VLGRALKRAFLHPDALGRRIQDRHATVCAPSFYGAQVPAHLMRVMILLRRDQRAAAWRATYDKERDRELS